MDDERTAVSERNEGEDRCFFGSDVETLAQWLGFLDELTVEGGEVCDEAEAHTLCAGSAAISTDTGGFSWLPGSDFVSCIERDGTK